MTCSRSLEHLASTNFSGLKLHAGPPTLARGLGSSSQNPCPFLSTSPSFSGPYLCLLPLLYLGKPCLASIQSPKAISKTAFSTSFQRLLAASHLCLSYILLNMCQSLPGGRPQAGSGPLNAVHGLFTVVNTHKLRDFTQSVCISSGPGPPFLLGNN